MDPTSQGASPRFPHYQLHLSVRYLRSRFSSLAALLSVTFGVGVIVITLSIMGGYVDVLRETIRGQESHLMVLGMSPFAVTNVVSLQRSIEELPRVKATAPFIETLAMYKSGQLNPCQLRGIHPRREAEVSSIGRYVLRAAELEGLLASPGEKSERVTAIDRVLRAEGREPVGGEELDRMLSPEHASEVLARLNPSTLQALNGDHLPAAIVGIQLLLDRKMFLGQAIGVGSMKPRAEGGAADQFADGRFVVVGAFKTGDYDFDSRVLFVNVDTLKNFLDLYDAEAGSYRYEGIRVALKDLSHADETRVELGALLRAQAPGLLVKSWEQLKANVLAAVVIEKWVIYFLLVLLMSFTGCMVLLMLLLTVIEKTRDMGILLALGATPGGVVSIFLWNGLLIVVAGTLLGLGFGYLFCSYINSIHDWVFRVTGWKLFPPEIYHMDRIPVAFHWTDVLLSAAPPLLLGFVSSLIPAMWASRRDPIKAIHYE